jgi:hypothetical protein
MPDSLRQQAKNAFVKDTAEYNYADSFLEEVRTNWRANENSITRTSAIVVGLAAAFELILENKATVATFLSINLSSTRVLEYALPPIIGYLYYYITFCFVQSIIFFNIQDSVLDAVYPALNNSNLMRALCPSNSLINSVDLVQFTLDDRRMSTLATITGSIRALVIAFGPPIFMITSYVQLLAKFGYRNAILWVSIVIAGALLAAGVVNFVIGLRAAA